MTNLTNAFGTLYHPQKAFLVYQQETGKRNIYVEAYDIDATGRPINAHPLSLSECTCLARALKSNEKKKTAFLRPAGLLPKNVLYLNPENGGYAVWYTPRQRVRLLFKEELGINSGMANVPALVWKASKNSVAIFAIGDEQEVNAETDLYYAPFFNIHDSGGVCMGNVKISIHANCGLEDFISTWEEAFFNSYFSHMMHGHNPVRGNMIQLWQSLSGTRRQFPIKSLVPANRKLKHLIK